MIAKIIIYLSYFFILIEHLEKKNYVDLHLKQCSINHLMPKGD